MGKWVTIKGAHVYIEDDGTITKGPKALKEKYNKGDIVEMQDVYTGEYTGEYTVVGKLDEKISMMRYGGAVTGYILSTKSGEIVETNNYRMRLKPSSKNYIKNITVQKSHIKNLINSLESFIKLGCGTNKVLSTMRTDIDNILNLTYYDDNILISCEHYVNVLSSCSEYLKIIERCSRSIIDISSNYLHK